MKLKRNMPTILSVLAGVGVVATATASVSATKKSLELIKIKESEKGDTLTKAEVIKLALPSYIPTILLGGSTIACIFGANVLNKRSQATLMGAYGLLDSQYKEYKNKVDELYGEGSNENISTSLAEDKYQKTKPKGDTELFYDEYSKQYFYSTTAKVLKAEYNLNRTLSMRDYAYANEYYEFLGLPHIPAGYDLGWSLGSNLDCYWQSWIDFDHIKRTLSDGTEYMAIIMRSEPIMDFENYF